MLAAAPSNAGIHRALLSRLAAAREETDKLFDVVHSEALYDRPIPERHRIIFYRGHLEAFDWNLLQRRLKGLKVFDSALDRLFAFGIDPVDGDLPSDQPSDWPAVPQVEAYVRRVREPLDEALAASDFGAGEGQESLVTLLNVALEHRLMHAETLAYMLHQLPLASKHRQFQAGIATAGRPAPEMIRIPSGDATLGLVRGGPDFGWDNEFDRHVVHIPGFSIDRFKVTNSQYLDFVNAGGYQARELWDEDAWDWIQREQLAHPVFWRRSGQAWRYQGMFDEFPLPLDWPVYVSHAEAGAYARWTGNRLPTEPEWHRAAYGTASGDERAFPWGGAEPATHHGLFEFERWDPWPVNAFPAAASAFGVEGLLGNGWEWTSTPFAPFKGFQTFPFYPGYSANFFDGKHYTMKGGSTRTARPLLRRSFRNWFQAHYQFVYAAFRCVRD